MGTITLNKLGGYCLILGPLTALIFWLIAPGGAIVDAADPADAQASIGAILGNAGLAKTSFMLTTLGIMALIVGIIAKQATIKGNGEALARAALPLIVIAGAGIALANGIGLVIAGDVGAAAGALYALNIGVNTVFGALLALGLLLLALAISTGEKENKIFALIVAAAALVSLVCQVIGGSDTSQLETTLMINGVVYVIFTLWSVMLGLNLLKE